MNKNAYEFIYVGMSVCVEIRGQHWVLSLGTPSCFFKAGSPTVPGTH